MTASPQSLPTGTPTPEDLDALMEADAQATIDKALRLFESGEKELAQRLFERLRQRVLEAGPTAMLISGNPAAEDDRDLRDVVNAIADVARSKPAEDNNDTSE